MAAWASYPDRWQMPASEDTASKRRPMLEVGTQFRPSSNCLAKSRNSSSGQLIAQGRSGSQAMPAARRCDRAIRYGRCTAASPPGSGT